MKCVYCEQDLWLRSKETETCQGCGYKRKRIEYQYTPRQYNLGNRLQSDQPVSLAQLAGQANSLSSLGGLLGAGIGYTSSQFRCDLQMQQEQAQRQSYLSGRSLQEALRW